MEQDWTLLQETITNWRRSTGWKKKDLKMTPKIFKFVEVYRHRYLERRSIEPAGLFRIDSPSCVFIKLKLAEVSWHCIYVKVRGRGEGGLLHPIGGPEERRGALSAWLLSLPQRQRGPGHHPLPAGHTPMPFPFYKAMGKSIKVILIISNIF